MKQFWCIVNWIIRKKWLWNCNQNSNIFAEENSLGNVVCSLVTILFKHQCRNMKDIIILHWIYHILPNGTHIIYYSYYSHQIIWYMYKYIDTLRPRQNGRHFADDIFKCIFLNENFWLSNDISLNLCLFRVCLINNVIIGSDNGLAPTRRQAIIRTNNGLVYWRIYPSFGFNESISLNVTYVWVSIEAIYILDTIQDCGICIVAAQEILQFYTQPLLYNQPHIFSWIENRN